MDCDSDSSDDLGVGDLELSGGGSNSSSNGRGGGGHLLGGNGWEEWSQQSSQRSNIWAPLDSDWMLLAADPYLPLDTGTDSKVHETSTAVQLSLALLNHHPERSSFTPVLPLKALQLPKNSKLMEWLAGLGRGPVAAVTPGLDGDEKEIENILKEPDVEDEGVKEDEEEEEEEENLLTSPKTHFCPIQQEGEPEVQVTNSLTIPNIFLFY